MKPHRSQTAGFFFPIPQLFRTGRKRAAFGWIAASFASVVLFIVGLGVAIGGHGAGIALIVIGLVALAACAVGELVHAHRAVRQWNESAEEKNYEQFLAWQRAADEQRQPSRKRRSPARRQKL